LFQFKGWDLTFSPSHFKTPLTWNIPYIYIYIYSRLISLGKDELFVRIKIQNPNLNESSKPLLLIPFQKCILVLFDKKLDFSPSISKNWILVLFDLNAFLFLLFDKKLDFRPSISKMDSSISSKFKFLTPINYNFRPQFQIEKLEKKKISFWTQKIDYHIDHSRNDRVWPNLSLSYHLLHK
jgi:hypothetical protein